jgi:hypothetical protein
MPTPRIMFDHDGRHPLIYMYEPPINREELEAAVDELAGTPVEALMLMLGDIRSLLYDTRAGELWGQNVEKWPHTIWRRAQQNFSELIHRGEDPLRVLCERAHAKGLLLYATLLTQQGGRERMLKSWENEDFDPEDWRLDVQPLDIGASGDVEPDWPGYRCPDFKHEEVRDGTQAVIQEVLDNYPVDGLELQLTYEPYYFHPDQVEAGRSIMSAWIGQVYEAVKKSDSERELVVHVPANLAGGLEVGLDPVEWIRQGIVDVVVAGAAGVGGGVDPSLDFRPLVEAAKGSQCRIHAAVASRVNTDRIGEGTIEMMRASACNAWAQGVDGIYLEHWFGCWPYEADFYEKLREIPHPDIMAPKDKIYHIPTATNAPPRPVVAPRTANPLPAVLEVEKPLQLDFRVSDDLSRWGDMGRVHEVLLRVRLAAATELDRLRFALNKKELPAELLRRINQMYAMSAPRYRSFGQWYVFKLDQEHWPLKGNNAVEVTLLERDVGVLGPVLINDVELEISYLRGKSFHRDFVDADLGPYEHKVI